MLKKVIMLLTNAFEPDVRVYKEAKSLVKKDHQVTILAWDRERKYSKFMEIDNIKITRCQSKCYYGKGLISFFSFIKYYIYVFVTLFNANIDIIHCHDLDTLLVGFLLAKLKGCTIIYDAHEVEYFINLPTFVRDVYKKIEKIISRRVDLILVVNQIQQRKFLNMNISSNKIVELRNCPSLNFFEIDLEKKKNDIVLGWTGYLQVGVGIEQMAAVFDLLCESCTNLRLLLIGKVHLNFKERLEYLVSNLKNAKNISIIGSIPYTQIKKYYKQINISFMLYENRPEFKYSTPTKLFEAMAQSIPVIATPIGDVREIVEACQCGFIVNSEDKQQLLEKMRILIENPSLREEMGNNGYHYAKKYFCWEIMEQRLLAAYENKSI
jgi:glycosyltransferase involved in cell wall biosynthesis